VSQTIGNPQIPQGILNLTRVNVQVPNFPQLNVTASYLGAGGMSISWGSPATTFINTLTGRVIAPEPFQSVTVGLHLVKSQTLAGQWESQRISLTTIGNLLAFTDTALMPSYAFTNCAIENVAEIVSNGKSTEYFVTVGGTYIVNNNLWALTV
jgi:hypothetical protein